MPQMMPNMWIFILIFLLFMLFMLICFIYFLVQPKMKITSIAHPPNVNKWSWMW